MNISKADSVAFIVTRNVQAASVFNAYGVDFFSKGSRTLEDACLEDHAPMADLIDDLWSLPMSDAPDFVKMQPAELIAYILRTHHKFAERKVVFIKNTIDKLQSFYPEDRHGLASLRKAFEELSVYLTVHMKHEEFLIFPAIRSIARSRHSDAALYERIENPLSGLKGDHDHEVSMLARMRSLTHGYAAFSNSDYALKLLHNAMRDLDEDLKFHMHLENNILFPKALSFAVAVNRNLN